MDRQNNKVIGSGVPHVDICGIHVSVVNLQLACEIIEGWIKSRHKTYVCVAPVSMIVDSHGQEGYRSIVNQAGMVTPDGMPLVWLGRMKGHKDIGRTYGPDLMNEMCQLSEAKQYKIYLYGGSEDCSQKLKANLLKKFSRLNIVGRLAPPFRALIEEETQRIISEINRANPDLLWVGLGSPKQDFWMAQHRPQLTVPVMIGVGAAFDFLAKTKKQAPRWMQQAGLEWFFRLCCEPRRLWKRYLIGNSQFIFFLMKNYFKNFLYR